MDTLPRKATLSLRALTAVVLLGMSGCGDDVPCWPVRSEAGCEAAGWTWYVDTATSYCSSSPDCAPPTHPTFCALPCEDDTDCEGTSVPWCGRVGYWGGRDNYGCSPFKVCVPEEPGYGCYDQTKGTRCAP